MKKLLITMFLSTIILFFFNFHNSIYAYPVDYYADIILDIEKELNGDGTSIIDELDDLIDYYEKMSKETNHDSRVDYILNKALICKSEYLDFLEKFNSDVINSSVYISAVNAAISAFNHMGLRLSAELLIFAKNNKSTLTIYNPIYGYTVCHSQYYKEIANMSITNGTFDFRYSYNNDGTNFCEADCYFALHSVRFTKEAASAKSLTIEDVYDFSYNAATYTNLQQHIVNLVAKAQELGYIIPFTVLFNPGEVHNNYDYKCLTGYKHKQQCKLCDVYKITIHGDFYYEKYTQDEHRVVCPCSAYFYENHSWVSARLSNTSIKMNNSPNYIPGYKCRYCGQTKYSNDV